MGEFSLKSRRITRVLQEKQAPQQSVSHPSIVQVASSGFNVEHHMYVPQKSVQFLEKGLAIV